MTKRSKAIVHATTTRGLQALAVMSRHLARTRVLGTSVGIEPPVPIPLAPRHLQEMGPCGLAVLKPAPAKSRIGTLGRKWVGTTLRRGATAREAISIPLPPSKVPIDLPGLIAEYERVAILVAGAELFAQPGILVFGKRIPPKRLHTCAPRETQTRSQDQAPPWARPAPLAEHRRKDRGHGMPRWEDRPGRGGVEFPRRPPACPGRFGAHSPLVASTLFAASTHLAARWRATEKDKMGCAGILGRTGRPGPPGRASPATHRPMGDGSRCARPTLQPGHSTPNLWIVTSR